ncbi:hypothetical protein A3Q56_00904 [Intoshia linei]|uniref:Adenosine kinase n=1 Tax=Intoshia linei TaxID=1819745 RepID=A0A177BCV5_9BILA|nr:hypothetical protein A3Q56_00904 [Intoshia linei]
MGYFFMLKPQCIIKLAKELFDGNKRIVYNISAEFICNLASTYIVKLMQYVHIIIGNDQSQHCDNVADMSQRHEFLSLAKLYNIEGKPKDLLKLLGEKIISQYNNHSLKLIMTCGSDPVFYAEFDDCEPVKFEKIEITKINPENIVDTNGAGDAFVGGFLSVYIKNENDYKRGIITGNKAAHYIIQQSGFTIQHDCTPPFM